MKKYVQKLWMRCLACLLCSVSAVGLIVTGVLMVGFASAENKEEVYQRGVERVAENYAAYIYDHREDDLETLLNRAEVGFTFGITKVAGNEETQTSGAVNETADTQEHEIVLYDNPRSDWDYQFIIPEGSTVYYDISSAWNALRIPDVITEQISAKETPVTDYLFDPNTGFFYYGTDVGYFREDSIYVTEADGLIYDYNIAQIEGEECYYNYYYDRILDTSAYETWEGVQFEDVYVEMIETERMALHGLAIVLDSEAIESQIYTDAWYGGGDTIYYYSQFRDQYVIEISLEHNYEDFDLFVEWYDIYNAFYQLEDALVGFLCLFGVLFIVSFMLLMYSAIDKEENLGFFHKFPVFTYSGAMLLVGLALCGCFAMVVSRGFNSYTMLPMNMVIALCLLLLGAMALIVFIWLQNIITRIKTKTFWRYSEFHYLMSPVKRVWNSAQENVPLFWKSLVIISIVLILEIILVDTFKYDADGTWFFVFIKMVEALLLLAAVMQMNRLKEGGKRISEGDLSHPIDTSKMFWEFKKHGENINNVSNSIQVAVDERMKSERLKTELITNVSHDIKTPLTSIINYVDLIKKEEITDETLCEYIDVLDRQSARLKKLIEDLMEASKASTGNLAVNMEECDVDVLLTQIAGEYEEKLQKNALEIVVEKPEHPVMIMADGRHIWRVFDNLLNNICKYSMQNTRVYVSLKQEGNQAIVVFKNISKSALNISSDELMERFVRGDSSRNTEGSGLGLSIAQSLTELMNGSMKLDIDGDLFKVTLTFLSTNSNK